MTHEEAIVAAGRLLDPVLLDPAVSEDVKTKIHDALNNLTSAIMRMG